VGSEALDGRTADEFREAAASGRLHGVPGFQPFREEPSSGLEPETPSLPWNFWVFLRSCAVP
ncbi:MAG: hypothetical protein LC808_38205, partial [Actinobacteria bacterium]|nr:hypothetical protein [Actinomycetota bacterium]